MRRTAGFRLLTSLAIAVGVTGLAWAGLTAGTFQGTQLRLSDGLFPAIAADDRIVVVAADENSLMSEELGRWPWDRSIHGRIIDHLSEGGAELIGYDVSFSEPSDPAEDRALTAAIEEAGNVILAANAAFEGTLADVPERDVPTAIGLEPPLPELVDAAAGVGHVNIIPDPDGVVRSLPPLIETPKGNLLASLSFSLLSMQEGIAEQPVTIRPEGIQLGETLVATGRAHLMDINFAEGFTTYSAVDVLEGTTPPDAFRDKVVLVGATALGLGDTRFTPLDKSDGEPGVYVHANALGTMLNRAFLSSDSMAVTLLWVFAVAFLVALAVVFLPIIVSALIALAMGAGYFFLAFNRFDGGHVMNLVYPTLALVLAYTGALAVQYFTEGRERRRVTSVFGRYVAGDVVEEVLAAPARALASLEGDTREISVLFADLRGFTSASEGATPREVVQALNVYLDAMVRAVNEELGTVDKFMGDCVMAFWGAPRPTEHHPQRAVRAAIRMLDEIDRAVESGKTAGLLVEGCGVGVTTGEAVVGNIGSTERLDYTVIGDTVNTSSRICGVAGAGQIVITEETAQAIGDEFRLAPLPPLVVKGKTQPLRVFQVLREGQEAEGYAEGATLDATEDKGHFEEEEEEVPADREPVAAPPKAAGYAPIEPRPQDSE